MQLSRNKICRYFDSLLRCPVIDDYSWNGLQVEGSEKIERIAFAVDAGIETFEKAIAWKADMIVVHHGLFWKNADPRLTGVNYARIMPLLQNNINLYAAHLPLDIHETIGNNAELIRLAGAKADGRFVPHGKEFIGMCGNLAQATSVEAIAKRLENDLACKTHVLGESRIVTRIATLSGCAQRSVLHEAKTHGAEVLITGELSEWYHDAQDYEISVIFVGHYASEQTGIGALMGKTYHDFPSLDVTFLHTPTGL